MRPARQDEQVPGPSEDTRKKAQAAKSYIENMYKVQYQNFQQRTDRFSSSCMLYLCWLSSKSTVLCVLYRRLQLERQLQTEKLTDEERQNILQSLEKRERDFTRLQRQRLSASDFELLTIIGRGAFGEVHTATCLITLHTSPCRAQSLLCFLLCYLLLVTCDRNIDCICLVCMLSCVIHHLQVRLCRQKTTGKVFAMKKLKKTEMVRRGQVLAHNNSICMLICSRSCHSLPELCHLDLCQDKGA